MGQNILSVTAEVRTLA